jgi:Holliday junction resolvase RusA-like endonuclease
LVVTITIPGDPVPWQRARRKGNRYFKAPNVVEYEQRVQAAWLVEGRPHLGTAPLRAEASFYFARPPSHLRGDGALRKGAPEFPSPDVDNLVKGVFDPLNRLAFADDRQVVELEARKAYAEPGDEPHTELELVPL